MFPACVITAWLLVKWSSSLPSLVHLFILPLSSFLSPLLSSFSWWFCYSNVIMDINWAISLFLVFFFFFFFFFKKWNISIKPALRSAWNFQWMQGRHNITVRSTFQSIYSYGRRTDRFRVLGGPPWAISRFRGRFRPRTRRWWLKQCPDVQA